MRDHCFFERLFESRRSIERSDLVGLCPLLGWVPNPWAEVQGAAERAQANSTPKPYKTKSDDPWFSPPET